MTDAKEIMEIELKLALDPAQVSRVKRHPLLAGVKAERQALHSIYYDTPDFALTRRLIALRLRRVGYHWVQTVKAAAPSVGALSSRPEWEAQVMGNQPDLAVLEKEARALLADIDLSHLAPVFITDVKRTTWQIEAGETTMEIALDQGEIRAGENTHPSPAHRLPQQGRHRLPPGRRGEIGPGEGTLAETRPENQRRTQLGQPGGSRSDPIGGQPARLSRTAG